jgi:hypothetical protein
MTAARRLRPPRRDTALDRAWRRRQWRLERAHDDWGLHAASGDPRAPIHRASGLVRLCRQSVRDKIRSCRQSVSVAGEDGEPAISVRSAIADAIRDYRLAVAALARAVTAFDQRNAGIRSTTSASRRPHSPSRLS